MVEVLLWVAFDQWGDLSGFSVCELANELGASIRFVRFVCIFDAKSRTEEVLLTEKFADYANYSTDVKKLIPGIY